MKILMKLENLSKVRQFAIYLTRYLKVGLQKLTKVR